ncbi:MAG: glycerol-3-phosphate 1-O-acyltransferase PlsY [Firmicutes bacterium]|jgi:glycerol-3-phosphate acyltransferase PlsY|nr:glycerol-3-phosphate 1-O-acyltransferase PlsY [Bacillota bacterium]
MFRSILVIIISYLVGSIPFGLIIGRLWAKIDVREYGSGNIGTSNVLRTVGPWAAITVFALDVAKGAAAVYLATLAGADYVRILAGVAAIVGHNWPIYLRFRGGKGIATSLGVVITLTPVVALMLLGLWIIIVGITRYISLASLAVAFLFPLFLIVFDAPWTYVLAGVLISAFAFHRHRDNIKRLLGGTEHKIGQKANKKADPKDS